MKNSTIYKGEGLNIPYFKKLTDLKNNLFQKVEFKICLRRGKRVHKNIYIFEWNIHNTQSSILKSEVFETSN